MSDGVEEWPEPRVSRVHNPTPYRVQYRSSADTWITVSTRDDIVAAVNDANRLVNEGHPARVLNRGGVVEFRSSPEDRRKLIETMGTI
jgi:hypothetical protein